VLSDFLQHPGVSARMATAATATEAGAICVCFLEEVTEARADHTGKEAFSSGAIRKNHRLPPRRNSRPARSEGSSSAWSGSLIDVLSAIEQRSASGPAAENGLLPGVHAAS
jgi:hypothetical protein